MRYVVRIISVICIPVLVNFMACAQQAPDLTPSPSTPSTSPAGQSTPVDPLTPVAYPDQQVLLLESDLATTSSQPVQGLAFSDDDPYKTARHEMVRFQVEQGGIDSRKVLDAMRKVPRHLFIPESRRAGAYGDYPVPVGYGQTISQPYIVGTMTQLLDVQPEDRVLEIGTGSGYQAAILAEICGEVVTIEIVDELARSGAKRLEKMGYKNITVLSGDGYLGYPPRAPYDKIIITAAVEPVPPPLIEQLAPGGKLVVPLGSPGWGQDLTVMEKNEDGTLAERKILPVCFVPFTREKTE
jgi:protein-L-isoaspartate(D-aspartate) O-methyltransferase